MIVSYSICSHGTVRNHATRYHSQKVVVGGMPQHSLRLASLLCFLDFALGESLHVPSHCLHNRQGCFGFKGHDRFGLKLPDVKIGHALAIVFSTMLLSLVWQMNVPLLWVESYTMGHSFLSCFSGMIVAILEASSEGI